jgi:hypothetical protein
MKNLDTIALDSIVIRNDKKFIASPIGDEIVMMSLENGSYIGINQVGTTIWEKLEHPASVKELITYLTGIYDITEEECEKKVIKYLNDLMLQDMIALIK